MSRTLGDIVNDGIEALDLIHDFYAHPLDRAILLATVGHSGQVDKQNQPYILHCIRVMLSGQTIEENIVGILHDLLEDTSFSKENLKAYGFSDETIAAVIALTKIKGQTLTDYYAQVKACPLALQVKLYDMEDNMSRLDSIQDEETKRRLTEKYQRGWETLTQNLEWEAF